MILIIESRTTHNSERLLELLGNKVILRLFESDRNKFEDILRQFEQKKSDIQTIIFHASGRHGVTIENATTYLQQILEWKSGSTKLFAVSEGSDYRIAMQNIITDFGAGNNASTDSYNQLVERVENEVERARGNR